MLRVILVLSFIFSTFSIFANTHDSLKEVDSNERNIITSSKPCTMTVVAIPDDDELCEGESTMISAITDDGMAPIEFIWAPGGQTSADITVTPTTTTTYSVTATDDQGCTAEHEVIIVVNPQPSVDITSPFPTICEGESTTITAEGSDGTEPYTFSWNEGLGGNSSHDISPTETTTYMVTLSDAEGCTATNSIVINVNPSPVLTASADPNAICEGSSSVLLAEATDGTPNYSYVWNQGLGNGATHTVSPSMNTTYLVTVTDDNNCTDVSNVQVQVLDDAMPTITGESSICEGTSTTLDAGNFATYIWSTGATTQTITVDQAGTYTVTVTNNDGCEGNAQIDVTVNALPSVTASATEEIICGGEISTIIANGSGGTAPYIYTWDNDIGEGEIHDVSPLTTTTYTVTVTDDNGCQNVASTTITVNENPIPVINSDVDMICEGEFANLMATASGGNAPYTFDWDQGLGLGPNQEVSPVTTTTYTVTVIDFDNCQGEESITIVVNSSPNPDITGATVLCEGDVSELTASGGFVSYLWNTNENTQSIVVEDQGTYSVTVVDDDGCVGESSVDVIVNEGLEPQITGNTEFCEGESSVLDAGSGFTSYLWNTGSANQSISVSTAGTYSVSVTNETGCEGSSSITVNVLANPEGNANNSGPVCEGELVQLFADGGTNYTWSGPNGFSSNEQNPIIDNVDNSHVGIYVVNISDDNGCVVAISTEVIVNPLPKGTVSNSGPVCEGEAIMLFASGGSVYEWSGPNGFSSLDQNPVIPSANVDQSGTYTVMIGNSLNCNINLSTDVVVNPNPEPVISGNTTICQGASATLIVVGDYVTFLWNTGSQDKSINVSVAGDYTVTVTDTNGCSGSATVTVTSADDLSPVILGDTVICGESAINLDAGSSFDNYLWSNGDTSQSITVTEAGLYIVEVSNNNGCMGTDSVEVIQSNIDFESAVVHEICNDSCDASITVIDIDNNDYLWSTGENTSSIENLCAGEYTVTVTDQFQCTLVEQYMIDEGYQIVASIEMAASTAIASGDGGVEPYTFLWNTGETTEEINLSGNATYTVTVTDANGCSGVESIDFTAIKTFTSNTAPTLQPNPANDRFIIDFKGHEADAISVRLFNLQGKKVIDLQKEMIQIDVSNVPAGIYLVQIQFKDGIYVKQIIVQH